MSSFAMVLQTSEAPGLARRAGKCRWLFPQCAETFSHDPLRGTPSAPQAYTQAALILDACKLATEFLAPKGMFVTKVCRGYRIPSCSN